MSPSERRLLTVALRYIAKYPQEFVKYCKGGKRNAEPDPRNSYLVLSFFRKKVNKAYTENIKENGSPFNRRNNLPVNGSIFRHTRRAKGSFGG